MNPTKTVLLATVAATLATGCFSRRVVVHERAGATPVVTREVVVTQAPPPAQIETVGAARPNSAWVPGYWKRDGSRWEWVKGHWETLPRGYNTYIPGHWEARNGGWVYYEGYWR